MLRVESPTDDDAADIGTWQYPGPWSVYDSTGGPLAPLSDFVVIRDDDTSGPQSLLGFACVGAEARVPGVEADPQVMDLGWGMRPDAVGQGRGAAFVETLIRHVEATQPPVRELRVVVQSWNVRGRRVVERAGFAATRTFQVEQGSPGTVVEYTELRRPW